MSEEEKNVREALREHDYVEAHLNAAMKALGEEEPKLAQELLEALNVIWENRRKLYKELAAFEADRRREAAVEALVLYRSLKECCVHHGPEEAPYW